MARDGEAEQPPGVTVTASLLQNVRILYVEDNDMNRLLVRRVLQPFGCELSEAKDGLEGVRLAEQLQPDIILMDINLPLLDGHACATRIKSIPSCRHIPIVAITAHLDEGARERSLIAGCDGYISKPINVSTFPEQIVHYLHGYRDTIDTTDEPQHFRQYSERLVHQLQQHVEELEMKNRLLEKQTHAMQDAYMSIIASFLRAVEEKHTYTAGHSARVKRYSLAIGKRMGLTASQMESLAQGALLHDIGKLVMEISSLKRVDQLSDSEWREMRRHPEIGYKILKPIKFLGPVVDVVHQHHERWDGSGYPQGLKGDAINLLACIVAVADSYDAMTTARGYNRTYTIDEAQDEFRKCSGTHFHPHVVAAFLDVLDQWKLEAMKN